MAAGLVTTRLTTELRLPGATMPYVLEYSEACDELVGATVLEIANGVTDESLLPSGLTTIQTLLVVSTVAITVKLGVAGSNVAFALAARAPLRLCGTSLTAASISNNSGEIALVTRVIAGT